jgi:hypothetical protein
MKKGVDWWWWWWLIQSRTQFSFNGNNGGTEEVFGSLGGELGSINVVEGFRGVV